MSRSACQSDLPSGSRSSGLICSQCASGGVVVAALQRQFAERQERIVAPTAAKQFVDDAAQQLLVAGGQAVAIPALGQRIDAAAIRGESFGRQPGELQLAVRAQADVAAVVERDDAIRVVGGQLADRYRRLRPNSWRRPGPGLAPVAMRPCPESN